MESIISSASGMPDSLSHGRGFESHQGHGDVSLSMSLHIQKNIMKVLKSLLENVCTYILCMGCLYIKDARIAH